MLLPSFPFPLPSFPLPAWGLHRGHHSVVHICNNRYFYISCSEVGANSVMPLTAPVLLFTTVWQWQFSSDPCGVIAVYGLHLYEFILLCNDLQGIQERLTIFPTKDTTVRVPALALHCTRAIGPQLPTQNTSMLPFQAKTSPVFIQDMFSAFW